MHTVLSRLRTVADEHGIRCAPKLIQALECEEQDPLFAGWLAALNLPFRDTGVHIVNDWGGDPNLFPLIDLPNGDVHALYLYPPWCAKSEPVVVTFLHETNFVEYAAATFEAFFDRALDDAVRLLRGREDYAALAQLTRDRLDLQPGARDEAPPAFLLLDGAPPPPTPTPGDDIALERSLLFRFLTGERAVAESLESVYERLNWRYARQQLVAG
jgi:hypothetical protein